MSHRHVVFIVFFVLKAIQVVYPPEGHIPMAWTKYDGKGTIFFLIMQIKIALCDFSGVECNGGDFLTGIVASTSQPIEARGYSASR